MDHLALVQSAATYAANYGVAAVALYVMYRIFTSTVRGITRSMDDLKESIERMREAVERNTEVLKMMMVMCGRREER